MYKFLSYGIFLSVLFLFYSSAFAVSSPYAGYWITYDGKSPTPRSIVKFTQKNNVVTGKNYIMIYTTYPPEKLCEKCGPPYRNASLIGLPIFEGHLDVKKEKQPCKVFNVGDGHHYSCYFNLNATADILTIRVYIGIPLFGRTLKWRRVPEAKLQLFGNSRWVHWIQI